MTNAELIYTLLKEDAPTVSFAGTRISQEKQPSEEHHPSVLFRSVASYPLMSWNNGVGTIPEDWVVESWAIDAVTRDKLRDAIRSRLNGYVDVASGVQGITLQEGGGAVEIENLALWGWQDTYRVIHRS